MSTKCKYLPDKNGNITRCRAHDPAHCRYHVGPNGKPLKHYDTIKEAKRAAEMEAEKRYVHQTRSLNHAIAFKKKYPEVHDYKINRIVEEGLASGKMVNIPTRDKKHVHAVPLRKIRQLKSTAALTNKLDSDFHDKYSSAMTHMRKKDNPKASNKTKAKYMDEGASAILQSYDNLNEDYELLKKNVGEWSLGDVAYMNADGKGGFVITSKPQVDNKLLQADLERLKLTDAAEKAGLWKYSKGKYDDKGNLVSKPSFTAGAVKKAFDASVSDVVKPGSKGAPKKRAELLGQAGLMEVDHKLTFDKKSYSALAEKNPDMVVGKRLSADEVEHMSEAKKRALLCSIGNQRNEMAKTVDYVYSQYYDATKKNDSEMKSNIGKGGSYTPTLFEGQQSSLTMKNKPYTKAVDSKVEAWAKKNGVDDNTLRSQAKEVHVADLREFTEKHKLNYYKYVKPVKQISFRSPTEGFGFGVHTSSRIVAKESSNGEVSGLEYKND